MCLPTAKQGVAGTKHNPFLVPHVQNALSTVPKKQSLVPWRSRNWSGLRSRERFKQSFGVWFGRMCVGLWGDLLYNSA